MFGPDDIRLSPPPPPPSLPPQTAVSTKTKPFVVPKLPTFWEVQVLFCVQSTLSKTCSWKKTFEILFYELSGHWDTLFVFWEQTDQLNNKEIKVSGISAKIDDVNKKSRDLGRHKHYFFKVRMTPLTKC